MATDHEKASTHEVHTDDGYFCHIACTCGEMIAEGPKSSLNDAKTAASNRWNAHFFGR
jgi:hypothetical protein